MATGKSKTAMIIAPLRKRLLQVRSAFTQCFPLSNSQNSNNKTRKRKLADCDCEDYLVKKSGDDKNACVLPLITDDGCEEVEDNETARLMADEGSAAGSPMMSPLSSLTVSSSSNSSNNFDEKPVTPAPSSSALMDTSASVVIEPLRPVRLASRVNRTFLLRKTKAALNKVKTNTEIKPIKNNNGTSAVNNNIKKPVSSSSSNSNNKIRFGLKSSSTAPSSSSKTSNSRPRFHSAKASSPGCLMTFIIFTNGSSTRMWFLVARQPENNTSRGSNNNRSGNNSDPDNNNNNNNENREPGDDASNSANNVSVNNDQPGSSTSADNHPQRPTSATSTGRRRNASTPPHDGASASPSSPSQQEKKRSLINRFLCSEDGKCTGADGRSRLAIAASWACPAAIKLLLRRGAPVNSVDSRGKAALHYVAYGHSSVEAVVECLLLLLDAGAKVNCFDDEYNTPLHLAALAGCGPAMGLLLRRGADSSLPNATGRTPVFNFLNNAFNADNIPALLELACGSPYAFAGAFHLSEKPKTPATIMMPDSDSDNNITMRHHLSTTALFDSSPSKKLLDCSGRMPLVLKLTLQPSLMPVHVEELSSQFKELLCLFATCPPSLQLLATHSIRNAILDALHAAQKSSSSPSTDSIKAAASVIDLPKSLKCFLFAT